MNCDGVTSTQRGIFRGQPDSLPPRGSGCASPAAHAAILVVVETRTLPRREAPEGRGPVAWVTLRSMSSSLQAVDALHPVVASRRQLPTSAGLRPLQATPSSPSSAATTHCCSHRPQAARPRRPCFPLLSRMADEGWSGLSVLYVCPLRALLNNLARASRDFAGWTGAGRRVARRHRGRRGASGLLGRATGRAADDTRSRSKSMLVAPRGPPALFAGSGPSSSTRCTPSPATTAGGTCCVVERLDPLPDGRSSGSGLSATVGNPDELLDWLQGRPSGRDPVRLRGGPRVHSIRRSCRIGWSAAETRRGDRSSISSSATSGRRQTRRR